jgi:2-methylcitrate dehydratase PrpD
VDLRSYQRPQISDPAVAALAARIRIVSDPAIEPTAIEPARVQVTLRDGRTTQLTATVMKGSPQQPMTDAELFAKFHDCLESGLGATRAEAERLAQAVAGIERSTDVARGIVDAFPLPASKF